MFVAEMFVSCFLGCIVGCLVSHLLRLAFTKEEKPTIKIKYFCDQYGDLKMLEKIEKGDWIDLYAAQDTKVRRGYLTKIPLGIAMELPKGYEAHVLPRSSTPSKFGIEAANGMGIIDNSYNGDGDEWQFIAQTAPGVSTSVIKKGAKICQFRIVKNQPAFEFIPVEHLDNEDRGGIGSTGKK